MKHTAVTLTLVAALALQAGCEPGDERHRESPALSPQGELAGLYLGEFPCSNCPAIEVALWLRPDARFLLRQRYVAAESTAELVTHALGHWRWDESAGLLVLSGVGPERRFAQLDAEHLQLQTRAAGAHMLARDAAAPPLAESFRIEGESVVGQSGIVFTECITGLHVEVAPGRGYEELLRQHRRLNRNGPAALTEIEGHLETIAGPDDSSREVLVVDRFLSLKPRTGC